MTPERKGAKKSERLVALTVKVTQEDFERLCILRARTHQKAQQILEKALRTALDKAKV